MPACSMESCIVLDYSKTSRVAGSVRDEIREIAPGLYIGVVYGERRLPIRFSLSSTQRSRSSTFNEKDDRWCAVVDSVGGADQYRDDHHSDGEDERQHRAAQMPVLSPRDAGHDEQLLTVTFT